MATHAGMGIDWSKVFVPETPLLEIFVRGTLTYLALFLMLRFVLKRESSGLGITDLLVVVMIADAAQNAMAGNYTSVPDGLLLVGTIIFWSWFLNWLGYHFPLFERLVHPAPLTLVKDGKMLRRNMRQELITESELLSQLREQGVRDLAEVRLACMEGDGSISVVTNDPPEPGQGRKKEQAT
ncbi:DUF421 domain-containing protein [Deinococcus metallilatus]|uniref:Uncharacterized membrane protein YcaP (DUF421 family) n=2 Tax=Deinococcus metallilatus TaxID=1211322 RepID=A0ABR6MZW4_9DEIO|nr:YetF domain-containing protein [Deinococcus metallilatus]MBB5297458.1 uncharacterized membrane protein YcaP (DUF421 family) [Deinococcus metallilatus]GMA16981.1 DUF421 domain-containing protein [Deinococcus metallilatus]